MTRRLLSALAVSLRVAGAALLAVGTAQWLGSYTLVWTGLVGTPPNVRWSATSPNPPCTVTLVPAPAITVTTLRYQLHEPSITNEMGAPNTAAAMAAIQHAFQTWQDATWVPDATIPNAGAYRFQFERRQDSAYDTGAPGAPYMDGVYPDLVDLANPDVLVHFALPPPELGDPEPDGDGNDMYVATPGNNRNIPGAIVGLRGDDGDDDIDGAGIVLDGVEYTWSTAFTDTDVETALLRGVAQALGLGGTLENPVPLPPLPLYSEQGSPDFRSRTFFWTAEAGGLVNTGIHRTLAPDDEMAINHLYDYGTFNPTKVGITGMILQDVDLVLPAGNDPVVGGVVAVLEWVNPLTSPPEGTGVLRGCARTDTTGAYYLFGFDPGYYLVLIANPRGWSDENWATSTDIDWVGYVLELTTPGTTYNFSTPTIDWPAPAIMAPPSSASATGLFSDTPGVGGLPAVANGRFPRAMQRGTTGNILRVQLDPPAAWDFVTAGILGSEGPPFPPVGGITITDVVVDTVTGPPPNVWIELTLDIEPDAPLGPRTLMFDWIEGVDPLTGMVRESTMLPGFLDVMEFSTLAVAEVQFSGQTYPPALDFDDPAVPGPAPELPITGNEGPATTVPALLWTMAAGAEQGVRIRQMRFFENPATVTNLNITDVDLWLVPANWVPGDCVLPTGPATGWDPVTEGWIELFTASAYGTWPPSETITPNLGTGEILFPNLVISIPPNVAPGQTRRFALTYDLGANADGAADVTLVAADVTATGLRWGDATITSGNAATGPAASEIDTNPTILNFSDMVGMPAPAAQSFTITHLGAGGDAGMNWVASWSAAWVVLDVPLGSLAAGASQTVNVTIDSSALTPGTYSAVIYLCDPYAWNNSRTVTVNLVHAPARPIITLAPTALSFTVQEALDPPALPYDTSETFTIENTGPAGTVLEWTGAVSVPWLSISPAGSGAVPPVTPLAVKDDDPPLPVTVTLNVPVATGLAAGTYTTTIVINSPNFWTDVNGAWNAPQAVTVTLTVVKALDFEVHWPGLKFRCNYVTEETGTDWDRRWVLIMSGAGTTLLSTQLSTTPGSSIALRCPSTGAWHSHQIPLDPAWGSVRVRFLFDTIDGVNNAFAGWFVDDVSIGPLESATGPTLFSENFDGAMGVWITSNTSPPVQWAVDATPAGVTGGAFSSSPNSLNYNDGTDYDSGGPNSGWVQSPLVNLASWPAGTLDFIAVENNPAPSPQIFTLTHSGGSLGNILWDASWPAPWLTVTPSDNNAPPEPDPDGMLTPPNPTSSGVQSLWAGVNHAGLAPGNYVTAVTFTAPDTPSSPQTLTVNLEVRPQPVIAPAPASLAFQAWQGIAPAPAPQNFVLTNSGGVGSVMNFTLSPSATWMTAAPTSGTLLSGASVTIQVTVSHLAPSVLAAGSYLGQVIITDPTASNSPSIVDVTLDVLSPATISLNPTALQFFAVTSTLPLPPAKTFAVTNTGGMFSSLAWNASWTAPWIASVTPNSGALASGASSTVSVQVNHAGLAAGTYTATISITAPNTSNSPQTVTVTLVVGPQPIIGASPISMTFGGVANSSPTTFQQTLTVTNLGPAGSALDFTVTDNAAWMTVSPTSGFLLSGASMPLTVTVSVTGLVGGTTYTGAITITAFGAVNSPLNVTVTFKVDNRPTITLSPTTLAYTASVNSSNPASQTFTVTNTGPLNSFLTWTAAYAGSGATPLAASKVTVSPTTGGPLSSGSSSTVTVSISISGLAVGTYTGTISVTSSTAVNSPQTVSITLDVRPPFPKITVAPTQLTYSVLASDPAVPAPQTVTVSNTGDTNSSLNWQAAPSSSWITVSPTTGTLAVGASETFSVSVNTASLAAGTYSETVVVSDPFSSNNPQTVNVVVIVQTPPATMQVSPATLVFAGNQDSGPTGAENVVISNAGLTASALSWSAIGNATWLQITPSSGVVGGGQSVNVAVTANVVSLAPGTYTATITISGLGTDPAPSTATVAVTLYVREVPDGSSGSGKTGSQMLLGPTGKNLKCAAASGGADPRAATGALLAGLAAAGIALRRRLG